MRLSVSESRQSTIWLAIVLAMVGLLAVLLYWPTMSLPLMYDDLLHIRISGGLDLRSVWLMAQNLPADHPVQAALVPDLLRPAPYNYGIHQLARGDLIAADWAPAGSHVFITTYDESGQGPATAAGCSPKRPPPDHWRPLAPKIC